MSPRLDSLLLSVTDFLPDGFLTGAGCGDGEGLEVAEEERGVPGVGEREEREEVLCFLKDKISEYYFYCASTSLYLVLAALVELCPALLPLHMVCLGEELHRWRNVSLIMII